MKHTMLLAPAAFLVVGLFSTESSAHGTVMVGVPPILIDTGTVTVAIGAPPPPPPVVVVEAPPPRERVVVVERAPPPPRQTVVVVREREPSRVVYVDGCDRCDHPGRGHHYGKHKHGHHKHHGDRGHRGDDRGHGHGGHGHRGYDT